MILLVAALLGLAADDLSTDAGGGALTFSPDGRFLASHGAQGLRIWDLSTGLERALEKPSAAPRRVPERRAAFAPDGKQVVLFGQGRFLAWDLEKGGRIRDARGPDDDVVSMLLSPDGGTLAVSGGSRITLRKTDGEGAAAFDLPEGEADTMAFSADGLRLAVSSTRRGRSGWVTVREAATGRELFGSPVAPPEGSRSLVLRTPQGALSPDGRKLAAARSQGTHVPGLPNGAATILIYDVDARQLGGELSGHTSQVWGAAFSRDGARLATWGSADLVVWDLESKKPLLTRIGMMHAAVFAPDASSLALIASPDERVHQERVLIVVDLATLKARVERPKAYYQDVAFSPDGKQLAASTDHGLRLWDSVSGDDVKFPR